jgi:hypothetical protein
MTDVVNKLQVVYVKTKKPENEPKEGVKILILNKGEKLTGTFENVYAPAIKEYKDELVLTTHDTKYVLSMNASLFKQLEWRAVQPGHEIEIEFDGTMKNKEKGKKPMNLFKIVNITQPFVPRKVSTKYEAIKNGSSTVTSEISDDELDD